MLPDISVLMPVYNGLAHYPDGMLVTNLRRALEADGVQVEVIVVDDCSTDDTFAALMELAMEDDRIEVLRHITNAGIARALNTAAEVATGRYLIVQSARSWYEPGALEAMAGALDDHPDVGFVYGQTRYHGREARVHIPPIFDRARFFRTFDSLFGYMYRREAIDAGCRYAPYLEREGRHIDISDYDFVMQLIVTMGWSGLALRDRLCLHYLYSGSGQMTALVHKYQQEIDAIFRERWGDGS